MRHTAARWAALVTSVSVSWWSTTVHRAPSDEVSQSCAERLHCSPHLAAAEVGQIYLLVMSPVDRRHYADHSSNEYESTFTLHAVFKEAVQFYVNL